MKIQVHQIIKGVFSASGISVLGDKYFIVGDNSTHLFEVDANFENVITHPFPLWSKFGNQPIPKSIKPDFEAMETVVRNNQDELWILGSGSQSPERDHMYIVQMVNGKLKMEKKKLTTLYLHFKNSPELNGAFLNLEALACCQEDLYFFNRGKNIIWKIHLSDFLLFLENETEVPKYQSYEIGLPNLNGIPTQFTGACYEPSTDKILFTAAAENTSNPIDDGEVTGSLVGEIWLRELKNGYEPHVHILQKNGLALPIKIESITKVINKSNEYILVTDSDGGPSELLVVQF